MDITFSDPQISFQTLQNSQISETQLIGFCHQEHAPAEIPESGNALGSLNLRHSKS